MNYNQFKNLSCYEEFEIQCDLLGISKLYILEKICNKIDSYYFFISNDGIFNWFDLKGNHVKDPCILDELNDEYIPRIITKCIIPYSVTSIGNRAFCDCKSLTSITIPNNVTNIGSYTFSFCKSLTSITIPDGVTSIGDAVFYGCYSLNEVIFKGKTLDEVKQMENYPFGIKDESIIKCEL